MRSDIRESLIISVSILVLLDVRFRLDLYEKSSFRLDQESAKCTDSSDDSASGLKGWGSGTCELADGGSTGRSTRLCGAGPGSLSGRGSWPGDTAGAVPVVVVGLAGGCGGFVVVVMGGAGAGSDCNGARLPRSR